MHSGAVGTNKHLPEYELKRFMAKSFLANKRANAPNAREKSWPRSPTDYKEVRVDPEGAEENEERDEEKVVNERN